MTFNISGFTHKGTGIYEVNEDQVLINGSILFDEEICLKDQNTCVCFVADGVGGNLGGLFAATYVLQRINVLTSSDYSNLNNMLNSFNEELINATRNMGPLRECACTLSGMIANDSFSDFYHVGDSEIWLLRNDMLMKVTGDEVLDQESDNSPLTNYFGGGENKLKINTEWVKPEILPGDLFLICSDGFFKSLSVKMVKPILTSDKNVEEKILKLKENCLSLGSDDNVSAVLVEVLG